MALEGQRVVITGGSSGIGLALARRVVGAGGEVVLIGRDEVKLARAAAEAVLDIDGGQR